MYVEDWFKKKVTLRWGAVRFDLDVAQELFSSHEVDGGSLLLLRSLDVDALPHEGRCLDYGCGYGVLGLALETVRPLWEVLLVDRDALAVAFSQHNAVRLGLRARACVGLEPLDATTDGYDLILWNVPGKAGAVVLARLMDETIDALALNGLLALVIVHPLADGLREIAIARADIALEREERGAEHTVLHLRRTVRRQAIVYRDDGFARGLFDRERIHVDHGAFDYSLTPVFGLPQYDGPDFTTLMMLDALVAIGEPPKQRVAILDPGVGHLAAGVCQLWPGSSLALIGRDALALRSSERAVGGGAASYAVPDLDGVESAGSWDLAVVSIEDQMRPPVMQRLVDEVARRLTPGGHLLVGGDSTEVTRVLAMIRKRRDLRERDRLRRRGASAALIECLRNTT